MIIIDTIGDLILRRWKHMDQVIECEHCQNEMTIRVKCNDVAYGVINKYLDEGELHDKS